MKKNNDIDPSRVEAFLKEEKALDEKAKKTEARRAAGREARRANAPKWA
jgi:hypothetical protein